MITEMDGNHNSRHRASQLESGNLVLGDVPDGGHRTPRSRSHPVGSLALLFAIVVNLERCCLCCTYCVYYRIDVDEFCDYFIENLDLVPDAGMRASSDQACYYHIWTYNPRFYSLL